MNRQPLPKVMVRPYFCCVLGGLRMLGWGVFDRRADAERKIDMMCEGGTGTLRREIRIERIYVSRRQR